MPSKCSLNVSLTPKLERFVKGRVAAGRYLTASEVVRDALRLLEHEEREHDAAFKSLKDNLERASAQADRDEFVEPKRVLQKIAALKARRSQKV